MFRHSDAVLTSRDCKPISHAYRDWHVGRVNCLGAALWLSPLVLPCGLHRCFETGKATWFAVHKTFVCDMACFDWTASSGVSVILWRDYKTVRYYKTSDSCNTNMVTTVETVKAVNIQWQRVGWSAELTDWPTVTVVCAKHHLLMGTAQQIRTP